MPRGMPPDPAAATAAPVRAKRHYYLHLWREFAALHTRVNTAKRAVSFAHTTAHPDGTMNVATVFPVHEDEVRRHAAIASGSARQRMTRAKDFVGLEEVSKIDFLVPLFAEALGTGLLVLIGCASCITWDATGPTTLHIAFAFGLAVAALAQVLGPISGCHVNPAVTVGLLSSGNCTLLKALCYVVCQCCGAIAGAAVLKASIPTARAINGLGATNLGQDVESGQGVLIEAIVTFLLVLVVHAVTDPKRTDTKGWAPLAIGLTISVAHMAAVPVTGSSMNPARTLGPAVILGVWSNHWVYWVGPLVGAVVAGGLYKIGLRARNKEEDEASYDF